MNANPLEAIFAEEGEIAFFGRVVAVRDLPNIYDRVFALSEGAREEELTPDQAADLTQLLESYVSDTQTLLESLFCCGDCAKIAESIICMSNRLLRRLGADTKFCVD